MKADPIKIGNSSNSVSQVVIQLMAFRRNFLIQLAERDESLLILHAPCHGNTEHHAPNVMENHTFLVLFLVELVNSTRSEQDVLANNDHCPGSCGNRLYLTLTSTGL